MQFGSFVILITFKFQLLLVLFASVVKMTLSSERFQFSLHTRDMLDPSWIYRELVRVDSRIQCASLCHRNEGKCFYFGYKDTGCILLQNNVNHETCSVDSCKQIGMKIYKVSRESYLSSYILYIFYLNFIL